MTDTTREADARAMETLENVKSAILQADIDIICDTLWMPTEVSPAETVVDYIDAALAALRPAQDAERVVHMKRGSTYEVIGEAEVQCAVMVEEGAMLTVYRCEKDGKLWARPTAEFRDGRFAASPPRTLEPDKI